MIDNESTASNQENSLASVLFVPGVKLRDVEKTVILETLKAKGFNRTHAAKTLGIGIRTLQRKLKKYGKLVEDASQMLAQDHLACADASN